MKIFTSIHSFKNVKKKVVLTIGVFDGMHVGHRRLIKKVINTAGKIHGISAVLTFDVHPEKFLEKSEIKTIKDTEAKINRLKILGVDVVLMEKFGRIKSLSADDFIRKYVLKNVNLHCIVAGEDFVFGKNQSGDVRLLKKMGKELNFKTIIVPDVKINGRKVSSTLIRKCLKEGNIKLAEKMLGRRYSITGKVVHGRQLGFKYPTANIKLKYEDIPANGVWAVWVLYKGKKYLGAANIGVAPTLKNDKKSLLEVYIFNFNKNIYGKKLRVVFIEKIRDEMKFRSYENLVKRVDKDIRLIKEKYRGR